jgi:hypothetical protein
MNIDQQGIEGVLGQKVAVAITNGRHSYVRVGTIVGEGVGRYRRNCTGIRIDETQRVVYRHDREFVILGVPSEATNV